MKILMLTPYLPYPLLSGGQTRTFNLLKKLSQTHKITLFSFIRSESEKKFIPELENLGIEVEVFKRRPAWQIFNILLAALSPFPFLVAIYLSRSLKLRIQEKLRDGNFDVVHAEPFYIVPNLPKLKVPLLLVDQTIEFIVYQHFVEKFKSLPLKPLLYFDVYKMKYWETKYWQQASRVVAMSEEDKKIMESIDSNLKIDIVPNGVDSDFFDRENPINKKFIQNLKDPVILYVGSCTWLQNREAIEVLYKKVWPKILTEIPNAKLWIIGKSADHFFSHLRSSAVRVDEVSDIREAYFTASVMVAPIYGRGGTRYKNFEAFASGLPVVTTSIGIGGIDAVDGQDVIIRDDITGLAKMAVKLIQDKKFNTLISTNARALVKKKYDWESISQKLSDIYEELGSR